MTRNLNIGSALVHESKDISSPTNTGAGIKHTGYLVIYTLIFQYT